MTDVTIGNDGGDVIVSSGGEELVRIHENGYVTIGTDSIHPDNQDVVEVEQNHDQRTYITATNTSDADQAQSGFRAKSDEAWAKFVMYPSTYSGQVMGVDGNNKAMLFTERNVGNNVNNPAEGLVIGTRRSGAPLIFATNETPRMEFSDSGEIELLEDGAGITVTSPDGSETREIGIDNDGNIETRDQ